MKTKAVRGVYEHPAGSGIYWIHYYADGKRHKEKAGRKSDAVKRKADARRKVKLPELVPGSSAHAPEMKPEQKQEQAVAPQQEQSFDIGLGL